MPIYLDNNATTRPAPEVIAAMVRALEHGWANPSSVHGPGQRAARSVEAARRQVAKLLSVEPERVVFASGATEANEAVLRHQEALGADLVTSWAEHPAVSAYHEHRPGSPAHRIPLDREGRWDFDALEDVLEQAPRPLIVGLSWANGETGVLQDAARIAALSARRGAACLVDATQVVGRVDISGVDLGSAYLTFSAHKLHGPKGVGAWVEPRGADGLCALVGGGQEHGRRGGTENVPGIVGMGAACELREACLGPAVAQLADLRDGLEANLTAALPDLRVNGVGAARVPNTSNITFAGVDGMALVARLEERGILCSQVSACSSGLPEPSRTLLAMGRSREEAFASVRFAVSVDNSVEEIDAASQEIVDEVRFLREMMGGLV